MVSTKDFAFIMDADLSTNIDYIKYFYDIISADDNLDSIIGIRGFKYNTGFRHIVSKLSYSICGVTTCEKLLEST